MNTLKENTTQKKTALKVYTVPLVMLVVASAFATPTASAEAKPRGMQTVRAAFHYNTDAPAQQIYGKLRVLVDRMCASRAPGPLALRRIDAACVDSAMKDGISRIGRTDIAALHSRSAG